MNRKPLHIFLDLDLTLVDIFPLWRKLWVDQLAQLLQKDAELIHSAGARIWEEGNLYTLEGHLRALEVNQEQAPCVTALQNRFLERVRTGDSNYEDTIPFLNALAHHRLSRSIISFGDPGYQRVKVQGFGRPHGFFQDMHFTTVPGEKAIVLKQAIKTHRVVLLDDNPSEHKQVARVCPEVHRIQICRQADLRRSSDAHHIVPDLAQTLDVVLSLAHKQPEEFR